MAVTTTQSDRPSLLIGPATWRGLPYAVRGHGIYIDTDDGRTVIDASSGALAVSLGHGRTDVVDFIAEHSRSLAFAHRTQFRSAVTEDLADLLARNTPGDLERSVFVSSGSDAIEMAIKMAVGFHMAAGQPRTGLMARDLSYHGATMGSSSLTGIPARRQLLAGLLLDVARIPTPHPGEHDGDILEKLRADFLAANPASLAAVVTEVVSGGSGGAIQPPEGYLQALRALCDEWGVLLIFDEVLTGAGRTGRGFAAEHFGVVPDMLVFGKGISGGYAPLAGVVVRPAIADALEGLGGVGLGHTYMNTPGAAAAGLAASRIIFDPEFLMSVRETGEALRDALSETARAHPQLIADVRGIGLLNAVEFHPRTDAASSAMTNAVLEACMDSGLMIYPAAHDYRRSPERAVVMMAPPLVITTEEVELLADRFASAVNQLERQSFATDTRPTRSSS